ncbi:MAG: proprotein convertase P-domain-containing protein [Candidatus Hydrogenedentes bacterium]|nr:proprotein convertase P-domain-containing protein [Candidatus Hydrogenedentota bacterium]
MGRKLLSFLAACVFVQAILAASAGALSPIPTGNSSVPPKVIYGTDDRIDVYEETDPLRLQQAASVCALMYTWDIVDHSDGTFTLRTVAFEDWFGAPLCTTERFSNQPLASLYCNAFLVGEDLVATAGDCLNAFGVAESVFVFGFEMLDADTAELTVDASQVYRGVAIVGRVTNNDVNYCVARLDRPVTVPGAVPFPLRRAGTVEMGTRVGTIGYPASLPKKLMFGANSQVYDASEPNFFSTNLDTYFGNVGGPVINQETGLVEGLALYGPNDYHLTEENCYASDVLPDEEAASYALKAATFAHLVPLRGPIPDNDSTGITGPFWFPQSLTVDDVNVSVDITHTAVGDLVVELISPTGTTVRLHNRTGGSSDDLVLVYDDTGAAPDGPGALAAFNGENAYGTWNLRVIDASAGETGTLNNWQPIITGTPIASIFESGTVDLAIPDNDPNGIASTIVVNEDLGITDVNVSVYLEHSFIGDLNVTLVSPSGTWVTLHDRTGAGGTVINETYDDEAGPPPGGNGRLADFIGENARGEWTLYVSDNDVYDDVGTLHSWGLIFNTVTTPEDIWDPADDASAGATELVPTEAIQTHGPHRLAGTDPQDYFRVSMIAGQVYHFTTVNAIGDTVGAIFDQDGNELAYDDDSGEAGQFSLYFAPRTPGTYYLSVSRYDTWYDARYTLSYAITEPPPGLALDPWDPADDYWDDANLLDLPTEQVQTHGPHTLSAYDYVDWFRVTLNADLPYEFTTTANGGQPFGLTVYAPGPSLVIYDETPGPGVRTPDFSGALTQFNGQSTVGNWRLRITDWSDTDTFRRLNSWQLLFNGQAYPGPHASSDTPMEFFPGSPFVVESIITVAENVPITDLNVAVELEHPYSDAIQIDLMSPSGSEGTLHFYSNRAFAGGWERVAHAETDGGSQGIRLILTPDVTGAHLLEARTVLAYDSASYMLNYRLMTEPVLTVDPSSLTMPAAGGSAFFAVSATEGETGLSWDAAVTLGASWLAVAPSPKGVGSGFVLLNAQANATLFPRTGVVQVEASDPGVSGSPAEVTVTQDPGSDEWDPDDDYGSGSARLLPGTTPQTHGPHTLSITDFADGFQVRLTQGVSYNFSSINTFGNTYAELRTESYALRAADDDSGEGLGFNLNYTPTETAYYYLYVRAYGSAGYTLRYSTLGQASQVREVYVNNLTGNDQTGLGTFESPWRTIQHAMDTAGPAASAQYPLTIRVADGTYTGKIVFRPYVRVAGEGADTIIQYYDSKDAEHVVIEAAEDTVLENCSVTVPATVLEDVALIQVVDETMRISNVVLNGRDSPDSIGAFITGANSSASSIENCVIRHLQYGIWAADSGVNIRQNRFEWIILVGVYVDRPAGGKAAATPILGDVALEDTSGLNIFDPITVNGDCVINQSDTLTKAEQNDWGVYTEEEIQAKVSPNVDFNPWIGKSILPGTVLAEMVRGDTTQRVSSNWAPRVAIDTLVFSYDNISSLFQLTNLPAGSYTVSGIADDYPPYSQYVNVASHGVSFVTLRMYGGDLRITITPAAAATAGAQWRVDGGDWRDSGYTEQDLNFATHTVEYKEISGWATPASVEVTVSATQLTEISGVYGGSNAADIDGGGVTATDVQLVINAALGLDIGGLDADVNNDNIVNATDIQLVINAALGL